MPSFRRQQGLAAAALVIVVLLALVAVFFAREATQPAESLDRREVTDARMRRVADALVTFAALNRRLPCPAEGNDTALGAPGDAGSANPDSATASCASPAGTVPWKTLALRREDALDGWGRKLSYRVHAGTTAVPLASGLTVADGVNMTSCNASLGAALDATLGGNSSCKSGTPPPNTPAQFLAVRGNLLVVNEPAGARNGNAFVLISHGESGAGAYQAEIVAGGGSRLAAPTNAGEVANTGAGGTYSNLARSAPGVMPADAAHFDDIVAYMSLADLTARAKLKERSWSQFALGTTFTQSAVEAAASASNIDDTQNTGQTSLAMGGFLITATSSSTPTPGVLNIGFREQDGIGGIGIIGGGSSSGDLNSAFGERLTFQLGAGSEFQQVDVALNAFEVLDFGFGILERAEISLWKDSTQLQATALNAWHDDSEASRCRFELVPTLVFDRIDVRPLTRNGDGGSTRFTVAAIKACNEADASCTTSVSGARNCPVSPASVLATTPGAIAQTTASMAGMLSMATGDSTTLHIDYGTTTFYGSVATVGTFTAAGSTAISQAVMGLTCGTTYHYRLRAVRSGSSTTSNDSVFTTNPC